MNARTASVILVSLCTVTCNAQLSDLTLQRLQGATLVAARPLELSVNGGCSRTYYAAEQMVISVKSPIDGYLYLFYFRADGEVTMMLFPCRHFWEDFPVVVAADTLLTIPPDGARISLAIAPPLGREAVLGLVIPSEQTDLVSYFRAYDASEYAYRTGDQEGFALFLARKVVDLQTRGVECAVSICVFNSAPALPAAAPAPSPPSLLVNTCAVGPEFRCASGELHQGCLPEEADIATLPREQLPDSSGPGDDAILLPAGHYTGALGEGDWHDWHRIRATYGDAFVVWLDPGSLVVDLYLVHDPCGDVLAECLSVEAATAMHVPCYAGVECPPLGECFLDGECRFFIRVVWRGGSGDYRLSIFKGFPEIPSP